MLNEQAVMKAPSGSDRAVLEAMLESSQIQFGLELTYQDGRAEAEAVSINIERNTQPLPGGYTGFSTEMVFSKEGKLLAVWSWE